MTNHDAMTEALAEDKSLGALVWLVEHGREVEFRADGVLCFLSQTHGGISLWVGQVQRSFPSAEALIRDEDFLALWNRAVVETIY